jgi:hypothetical protein
MCMRSVAVGVGGSFRVLMSMAVTAGMIMRFCRGLGYAVAAEVVVVMTVSRRGNNRLGNTALFTHLGRLSHLVVVLGASPLRMGREPFERWLIHVARKRHLRIAHAERPWILRPLRHRCRFAFMVPVSTRSNSKSGYRAWRFPATLRARFLLGRLTERGQQLKREVTGETVVFINRHMCLSELLNGGRGVREVGPVFRIMANPDGRLVHVTDRLHTLNGQRGLIRVGVEGHRRTGVDLRAQMDRVSD